MYERKSLLEINRSIINDITYFETYLRFIYEKIMFVSSMTLIWSDIAVLHVGELRRETLGNWNE